LNWTRLLEVGPILRDTIVQGGEDALDALRYRSLSEKEPLILGFFCGE